MSKKVFIPRFRHKDYPFLAEVIDFDFPKKYPFRKGDVVLILGEISNMPTHYVGVGKNGKVFFGYHEENFTPLSIDET